MLHSADKVELPLGVGEDKVVIKPVVVSARALGQHVSKSGRGPENPHFLTISEENIKKKCQTFANRDLRPCVLTLELINFLNSC